MLFDSCDNNNSSQEDTEQLASSTFIDDLCLNLGRLGACPISFQNKRPHKANGLNDSIIMNGHEVNDSNALIVITIPGSEINDSIRALKEEELRKLYAIKSLGELVAYSDSIGAELNEFPNDSIGLVVQLSGYEIKRSLNPMVDSSKNYLKAKGFSENEINELLIENNLTEYNLIEVVIGLTECERYDLLAYNERSSLVFQAKAQELDIDWIRVGYCAYQTIGGDIIDAIRNSGSKKITKSVITKAVKAVAKKLCMSYVSIAIAVIDFGNCYIESL